eukprot:2942559-Rhodomonas_salina.1
MARGEADLEKGGEDAPGGEEAAELEQILRTQADAGRDGEERDALKPRQGELAIADGGGNGGDKASDGAEERDGDDGGRGEARRGLRGEDRDEQGPERHPREGPRAPDLQQPPARVDLEQLLARCRERLLAALREPDQVVGAADLPARRCDALPGCAGAVVAAAAGLRFEAEGHRVQLRRGVGRCDEIEPAESASGPFSSKRHAWTWNCCVARCCVTLRNRMQETAFLVQIVLKLRFLVLDFGVEDSACS